jgi:malate dehydrogenase
MFSSSSNFRAEFQDSSPVAQIVTRLMQDQRETKQRQADLISLKTLIDHDANAFAEALQVACEMGAQLRNENVNPFTEPRFLKAPVNVVVTGASGQIAYSLIPRILTGEVFGYDTPINIRLIDIPEMENAAKGVAMELADCAFPLMNKIEVGSSDNLWKNVDYAFLVGAKPRGKGMERADLLRDNGVIFQKQGQLLNQYANSSVLVLVVGNPANTNAMIAANNAPKIDKMQFSAMTRLDHDRALAQIADKIGVNVGQVSNIIIWGNHSSTQVPDVTHAKVWYPDGTTKPVTQLVDSKWLEEVFTPAVQQRGAAIINARGSSSAASAADAAIKHMADWVKGFDEERKSRNDWVSMALPVDNIAGSKGLWVSVPVVCEGNGKVKVVENVLDKSQEAKVKKSVAELDSERLSVKNLIK